MTKKTFLLISSFLIGCSASPSSLSIHVYNEDAFEKIYETWKIQPEEALRIARAESLSNSERKMVDGYMSDGFVYSEKPFVLIDGCYGFAQLPSLDPLMLFDTMPWVGLTGYYVDGETGRCRYLNPGMSIERHWYTFWQYRVKRGEMNDRTADRTEKYNRLYGSVNLWDKNRKLFPAMNPSTTPPTSTIPAQNPPPVPSPSNDTETYPIRRPPVPRR